MNDIPVNRIGVMGRLEDDIIVGPRFYCSCSLRISIVDGTSSKVFVREIVYLGRHDLCSERDVFQEYSSPFLSGI